MTTTSDAVEAAYPPLVPGGLQWFNPRLVLPPFHAESRRSPLLLVIARRDETPWKSQHYNDPVTPPEDEYDTFTAYIDAPSGPLPKPSDWTLFKYRQPGLMGDLEKSAICLWALLPIPPARRVFADLKAQHAFYDTHGGHDGR